MRRGCSSCTVPASTKFSATASVTGSRGEHRDRQARRQHARHRDHQQHHEQHEGAGGLVRSPSGLNRMNIQARPKNRSSVTKRMRQRRMSTCARRLGQELPAFGDEDRVDDQNGRGPDAGHDRAGPQAGQEADRADQQQDDERGRQPVLRELAQQLVIESRRGCRWSRSGGRAPRARAAPRAAALGRRLLARHRNIACSVVGYRSTTGKRRLEIGLNLREILKRRLRAESVVKMLPAG